MFTVDNELLKILEKLYDDMPVIRLHRDEIEDGVREMTERGYSLASISNTGITEPDLWRLTFTRRDFINTNHENPNFDGNMDVGEFLTGEIAEFLKTAVRDDSVPLIIFPEDIRK